MAKVFPLLVTVFFVPALYGSRYASPVAHAGGPQPPPDAAKEPEARIKEIEATIKELDGQLQEAKAMDLQEKIKELEEQLRKAKANQLEVRHEAVKAQDLKKLRGNWVVVRYTSEGRERMPFFTLFTSFTFKDNFTIDVTQRPKRLYLDSIGPDFKLRKIPYIYTFDDEHLLLGETWWGERPPLDFGSVSGNFWRLERAKGK